MAVSSLIVAMLCDLAAQEDLLFLLAEGKRTECAHAPLADHLARDFGGPLDVVACASGHVVKEDLFGDAAAHQDGKLRFEIVLGSSCAGRRSAAAW